MPASALRPCNVGSSSNLGLKRAGAALPTARPALPTARPQSARSQHRLRAAGTAEAQLSSISSSNLPQLGLPQLPELPPLPEPLAQPVAWASALAQVSLRYAVNAALDAAAEASVALAEAPARLRGFQEEVDALAQRELRGAALLPAGSSSSSSSSSAAGAGSSSSGAGGSSSAGAPGWQGQDLAALVDELRADIAASRAILQQIRVQEQQQPQQPASRR